MKLEKYIDKKTLKTIKIFIVVVLVCLLSYVVYFKGFIKFMEYQDQMVSAAERYFEINPTHLPDEKNVYKTLTLQELYDKDFINTLYVPGTTKFCNVEESFVRVINKDGKYKYLTYLDCKKYKSRTDHEGPEVTLNGETRTIVALNSKYEDAGVKSVVDKKDGKIKTDKVEVISDVDTSKLGTYKVVYRVLDKNYNLTRVEREVIVARSLNNEVYNNTIGTNIYSGQAFYNYVNFSGMLFRIVKTNEDGSVKLVSEDAIAHVDSEYDNYQDSNLYKWLNEYYYNSFSENSKKYMVESDWCTDSYNYGQPATCNNKINAKVGLLTLGEVTDSIKDGKTYLIDRVSQTLLLTRASDNKNYMNYYIESNFATKFDSVIASIRPVINIKANTFIASGKGTYSDPYILPDYTVGKENDMLSSRLIGEYVNYSGYLYRIYNIDKDKNISLIGVETFRNASTDGDLKYDSTQHEFSNNNLEDDKSFLKYLNNNYVNYIDASKIIEYEYKIPHFDPSKKYNEYQTDSYKAKLGIASMNMLFSADTTRTNNTDVVYVDVSDVKDTILFTNSSNQHIFKITNGAVSDLYNYKIIITLNNKAKIASGKGLTYSPYTLR